MGASPLIWCAQKYFYIHEVLSNHSFVSDTYMSVLLQHLAPDLTIIDYLSVVTEICIKNSI